jgi:hypothetical protein
LSVQAAAVTILQSSIPALEWPHQEVPAVTNRFLYIKAADADALLAPAAARTNKNPQSSEPQKKGKSLRFFVGISGKKWQKSTAKKFFRKKSIRRSLSRI